MPKDKVVGTEEATKRARANGIHRSRLKINEDSARHILVGANLVVVHGDTLELLVIVTLVDTVALDTVLIRDDLPEFGT